MIDVLEHLTDRLLRQIIDHSADERLRSRARAELALRAERSRQRVEEHRIQRATVHPTSPGHAPEPEPIPRPAPSTSERCWHHVSGPISTEDP